MKQCFVSGSSVLWAAMAGIMACVGCGGSSSSATGTGGSGDSSAAYYQSGGTATLSNQTYEASSVDESGVKVENAGTFTLSDSTITTSGNTSSQDNSSFYGLNAGVLAATASTINLTRCTITTTGTGANGAFAYGTNSKLTLDKVTIRCSAEGGHGVDATYGGILEINDCDVSTQGAHGAAISTDRGGGTVTVSGGTYSASGTDSPGIYSTGAITVSGASVSGTGAEAVVIEGANSATLNNVALSGAKGSRDRGVLVYQSTSGDAEGNQGVFTMTGGSFTWPSTGPAFYVTNTTGIFTLKNVTLSSSSLILLAAAADQWGTSGSNGGTVQFTADAQALVGSFMADGVSSLAITLQNGSTLSGAINAAHTAQAAALSLDTSSTWTLTGDSYLTSLSGSGTIHKGSYALYVNGVAQ